MNLFFLFIFSVLLWSRSRIIYKNKNDKIQYIPGLLYCLYSYPLILNKLQCFILMQESIPYLQTSKVNYLDGSDKSNLHTLRNSYSCAIRNHVTDYIHKFASKITGYPLEYHEDTQVTFYKEGGHYSLHFDKNEQHPRLKTRICTLIFYLNECDGGETEFPYIQVKIKPKQGNCVLFWDGMDFQIKESCHRACPVLKGTKWIAQQWIHSIPYMTLYGPK
jgi:prolyl 4-hydroxylase